MKSNVNKKIAVGAAWMIGSRQLDRFIGLISMPILAHLLMPDDFGLVVYAMTFIGIVEVFFLFGFETVLIRDQDAGRSSYDTAWTMEVIKGVTIALLFIACAKPVAAFFNEPRVELILYYFAVIPVLSGMKNIGIVDFQKKFQFDKEFLYRFVVRIVSISTTVFLAFQMRTYWALVYGMMFRAFLGFSLSYVMCNYRPRFDLREWRRVFGFSKWLLAQNFLLGINARLPVLVLGRYFEASVAAIFNIGRELSSFASAEFAAPIRRALYPGIASIAEEQAAMLRTIVKAVGVIAFVGLPVTIGIAAVAPIAIPLILGDEWLETIPVMQILALSGVGLILNCNSQVVYYAIDKPHLATYLTLLRTAIAVPSALILIPRYGAVGAAWSLSITNLVFTVAEYLLFFRIVDISPWDFIKAVWRSLVAVSVMGLVVSYCVNELTSMEERLAAFPEFSVCVFVGAATYTLMAVILWVASGRPQGAESYVLKVLKRFLPGSQLQV